MAKPLMRVSNDLNHSKVLELLEEADKSLISHVPPAMPKAGDVYVYEPMNDNSSSKSSNVV